MLLGEKDDLAQGTSSRSGKLVHGGLRYLEYYEFRLVREALIEREVLLARRAAYHLADAVRAAAQPGAASGLAGPAGPVSLRSSGRAQMLPPTRGLDLSARRRAPVKPEFSKALRIFGLLGGRCAAGGPQRAGRQQRGGVDR